MRHSDNLMPIKALWIVLLLISTGCEKFSDFGNLNTDPTRSSSTDPANQLLFAQLWFSGDLGIQERTNSMMLMPMMQQFAGAYYAREGGMYIKNTERLYRIFANSYPNDVVNIVDAVERTTGVPEKVNLNAIARIMKVYTFARITDLYGDIPYSQAGKGFYNQITKPKYDTQEEIYNDFFKELKEASAQLDASKDKVPDEVFYNGDIMKWKKFANSLRIRLAMRLVKVNPEKARQEVTDAYNADGGVFTANSDLCKTVHMDNQNTYADFRGNGASAAMNRATSMPKVVNTFLNQLRSTGDPRLKIIVRVYRQNSPFRPFEREDITAQIAASPVGLTGSIAGRYVYEDVVGPLNITLANGASYSAVNNDIKAEINVNFARNNAPFLHLTYAEVELLLAEAAVRWGLNLGGDAEAHYRRGVQAAIQQLNLFQGIVPATASEITAFLDANPLTPGQELKQINTQLWIALMLNGPETYANWRRSGYPELIPSPNYESTITTIPRRFEYPLTEKDQNKENVEEAIRRLGADDWTKRVWWDKE